MINKFDSVSFMCKQYIQNKHYEPTITVSKGTWYIKEDDCKGSGIINKDSTWFEYLYRKIPTVMKLRGAINCICVIHKEVMGTIRNAK